MQAVRVSDLSQLRKVLENYSAGFLFRGQTGHYTTPSCAPSLTSSFVRKGCIPRRMYQWSFWAHELLSRAGVPVVDRDLAQAFLQHYGWRSFFLDLTMAPWVAAWFASNSQMEARVFQRLEEPFDNVLLYRNVAQHVPNNQDGHLYILSKDVLWRSYRLYDLTGLQFSERSRPEVQQAWLAGPLSRFHPSLEPGCISAHVSGPAEVFREFAAQSGYTDVSRMFPSSSEDPVLRQLEAQPWLRVRAFRGVRTYARSIDFPDYHDERHTLLPPSVALYTTKWLAGRRQGDFAGALFFKSPDSMFYISDLQSNVFGERFWSLLDQHGIIAVESRTILRIPRTGPEPEYFKGVVAERDTGGALWVSELFVDHPEDRLVGWGTHLGYRYECRGGAAVRSPAASECPCGDVRWHTYHLAVLRVLSQSLDRESVRRIDDKTYRIKEW